jgi:hypothetical protein
MATESGLHKSKTPLPWRCQKCVHDEHKAWNKKREEADQIKQRMRAETERRLQQERSRQGEEDSDDDDEEYDEYEIDTQDGSVGMGSPARSPSRPRQIVPSPVRKIYSLVPTAGAIGVGFPTSQTRGVGFPRGGGSYSNMRGGPSYSNARGRGSSIGDEDVSKWRDAPSSDSEAMAVEEVIEELERREPSASTSFSPPRNVYEGFNDDLVSSTPYHAVARSRLDHSMDRRTSSDEGGEWSQTSHESIDTIIETPLNRSLADSRLLEIADVLMDMDELDDEPLDGRDPRNETPKARMLQAGAQPAYQSPISNPNDVDDSDLDGLSDACPLASEMEVPEYMENVPQPEHIESAAQPEQMSPEPRRKREFSVDEEVSDARFIVLKSPGTRRRLVHRKVLEFNGIHVLHHDDRSKCIIQIMDNHMRPPAICFSDGLPARPAPRKIPNRKQKRRQGTRFPPNKAPPNRGIEEDTVHTVIAENGEDTEEGDVTVTLADTGGTGREGTPVDVAAVSTAQVPLQDIVKPAVIVQGMQEEVEAEISVLREAIHIAEDTGTGNRGDSEATLQSAENPSTERQQIAEVGEMRPTAVVDFTVSGDDDSDEEVEEEIEDRPWRPLTLELGGRRFRNGSISDNESLRSFSPSPGLEAGY